MNTKFLALICVIGVAGVCIAQAQSPTPAESPTKHRAHKKADTAASSASTAASPSPAASPIAKRGHKKTETATASNPAPSGTPPAPPATSPNPKPTHPTT